MMSYNSLQIHLYKVALDEQLFHPTSTTDLITFSSTKYNMLRMELLTSCLAAIKSLLSLFFALPAQTIISLLYPTWGQISHGMVILSRLSDVTHGTWNSAYVSTVLDPQETYRNLAARLEEVMIFGKGESPPRMLPDIFRHMVARLMELGEPAHRSEISGTGIEHDVFSEENISSSSLFDFLDMGGVF